jgi:hypothetical protein
MGRSAAARQTAADQFMEAPMLKTNDLSRSVTPFKQGNTLIAVVEMSLSSWLVAGIVPGMERHPLKKLDVDPDALLRTAPSLARGSNQGWLLSMIAETGPQIFTEKGV